MSIPKPFCQSPRVFSESLFAVKPGIAIATALLSFVAFPRYNLDILINGAMESFVQADRWRYNFGTHNKTTISRVLFRFTPPLASCQESILNVQCML